MLAETLVQKPFNRATENMKKQMICNGKSEENVHLRELPVTDLIVSLDHYVFLAVLDDTAMHMYISVRKKYDWMSVTMGGKGCSSAVIGLVLSTK